MRENELDQEPHKDGLQAETWPRIYCVYFHFNLLSVNHLKLYRYVTQNLHASQVISPGAEHQLPTLGKM